MKNLLVLLTFSITVGASAQIPNGSTAPDFTLTDLDGTTHNLYSYLDAGKTVFIKFFACHCPSCWAYHQTHKLKSLYNLYGPDGTDEIMILALEHDQWNSMDAFMGIGDPWVTQGDWVTGTPYPQLNVEDPDRGVFTDYGMVYYPLIMKVCPDRKVEQMSTSLDGVQLYEKVQGCQTASTPKIEDFSSVYIDQLSKNLMIEQFQKVKSLRILNMQGQLIKTIGSVTSSTINLDELNTGIYLFEIQSENGPVVKKLHLN